MTDYYPVQKTMERFAEMRITPESVRAEVQAMAAHVESHSLASNDELHLVEDDLYEAVLRGIAAGHMQDIETARSVCREALATQDIKFSRWYD